MTFNSSFFLRVLILFFILFVVIFPLFIIFRNKEIGKKELSLPEEKSIPDLLTSMSVTDEEYSLEGRASQLPVLFGEEASIVSGSDEN